MVMKCSAVHGTQMNDGFTNLLDWYTDCVCKAIFFPNHHKLYEDDDVKYRIANFCS